MEIFNTANPIVILVYTIVIAGLIYLSRKKENVFLPIILMAFMIGLLVMHSLIKTPTNDLIRIKFISIAFDLIFLFLSFITYLWVDDIHAKKNNIKSYDNSLSWFWDDI